MVLTKGVFEANWCEYMSLVRLVTREVLFTGSQVAVVF
jgi:hypothetical protein